MAKRRTEGKDSIAGLLDGLSARIGAASLRPALEEIGEVVVSSIQKNFQLGGRFGSGPYGGGVQRWKKSYRAAHTGGGKTLLDTARLASSIRYDVSSKNQLTIGTNVIYGRIHQFGGVITPVKAKALRFRLGKGPGDTGSLWVIARRVRIPARPYMVLQDEDLDEITAIIRDHYAALL